MVISIFSNYQQQQISVYAQQLVKILRRSDGGKSIKMSFKNVRYSAQKTVSNHLKKQVTLYTCTLFVVGLPVLINMVATGQEMVREKNSSRSGKS